MSELSERLKAFLTPEQRDELKLALAACDSWPSKPEKDHDGGRYRVTRPTPSPAPDKILDWESGDWWSDLSGGCWQHRGNKCRMLEVDGTLSDWRVTARPIAHGEFRLDDAEGDKRAASKGYTVRRTAKVQPAPEKDHDGGRYRITDPLPTAKETPSVDDRRIDADWCQAVRDLETKVETLTADLERYRARLANLEGKVNK